MCVCYKSTTRRLFATFNDGESNSSSHDRKVAADVRLDFSFFVIREKHARREKLAAPGLKNVGRSIDLSTDR